MTNKGRAQSCWVIVRRAEGYELVRIAKKHALDRWHSLVSLHTADTPEELADKLSEGTRAS